jgi:hypothetical protein
MAESPCSLCPSTSFPYAQDERENSVQAERSRESGEVEAPALSLTSRHCPYSIQGAGTTR